MLVFNCTWCSAETTDWWVMTTSVKHSFFHSVRHFTETHFIHKVLPTIPTFPWLTLAVSVWKTDPLKPTRRVDYHFNGLAHWVLILLGWNYLLFLSDKDRVDKREGGCQEKENNISAFIGCPSPQRGASFMLAIRSRSQPWMSLWNVGTIGLSLNIFWDLYGL